MYPFVPSRPMSYLGLKRCCDDALAYTMRATCTVVWVLQETFSRMDPTVDHKKYNNLEDGRRFLTPASTMTTG